MKKIISILLTLTLLFALSISVFAESADGGAEIDLFGGPGGPGGPGGGDQGGDVKVNGSIKEGIYNVKYPSQVNWYVTDASNREVWNSPNNNNNVAPNTIQNLSKGSAYNVTLKKIILTNKAAESIAKNLELYLTGNLAKAPLANKNINNGYSGTTAYKEQLTPGSWTFGFTGKYNAWLSSTSYAPTYTMTIGFAMDR